VYPHRRSFQLGASEPEVRRDVGAGQHHGELVAVEPGHDPVRKGVQQPTDGHQQLVPRLVAEGVVDVLAVSELEDQGRPRARRPGLDGLDQAAPVEQPGQWIVPGFELSHDRLGAQPGDQPRVVQRHTGGAGESREDLRVVRAESPAVAHPIDDHQDTDGITVLVQRHCQGVLRAWARVARSSVQRLAPQGSLPPGRGLGGEHLHPGPAAAQMQAGCPVPRQEVQFGGLRRHQLTSLCEDDVRGVVIGERGPGRTREGVQHLEPVVAVGESDVAAVGNAQCADREGQQR